MLGQSVKPIRRASLVDEIASRLQDEILKGQYRPGAVLPPERELSERYGVTRTSLKHALVRLEEMGLIETRHGVGSVVKDVQQTGGADLLKYLVPAESSSDISFVTEVAEARTYVAAAFAGLAARRRTEDDLETLEELVDALSAKKGQPEEVQRLENEFVRALSKASHNRAFILLTNSVVAAYRLFWGTYRDIFLDGAWVERSLKAVFEAIRDQDEERARITTEEYFHENDRRLRALQARGAK